VFTVTVVEAEFADAITRLPLEVLQDEKLNGPPADAVSEAEEPESYQPSPVWLAPIEYESLPLLEA